MKQQILFGLLAGLLVGAPWQASAAPKWISAANAPEPGDTRRSFLAPAGTSQFRTDVTNDQAVVRATLTASGLGVFNAFINGVQVGDEILKPGFTHGRKTKYAFTWDVTDLVKREAGAVNAVTATVSTGWWNDKVAGYIGRRSAFWGALELTYADGTTRTVETDETWRAGVGGPLLRAGIFDGEVYDARLRDAPVELTTAVRNDEFTGEVLPQKGAGVFFRDDLALEPVAAYAWQGVTGAEANVRFGTVVKTRTFAPGEALTLAPGETLVVDFGQNAAAVPDFAATAAAGVTLTIRPGEMLNDGNGERARGNDGPAGSVYRANLRELKDAGARLDYTFAGTGVETYRPAYTFFGYRYVSLTATGPVTLKSLRSIPVSSITPAMERGTLTTGVPDVNRLIRNIRWGQYSNYLSVPTDCPQRNERQGWTADTQVFAPAAFRNADVYAFLDKYMRDMADTQRANGSFTSVAPVGTYGDAGAERFGWVDAGVIIPYVAWRMTGDDAIIRRHWAAMKKFFEFVKTNRYAAGDALNYQWADWLSYEKYESHSRQAWDGKKIKPGAAAYWKYLGGCYWLYDAKLMGEMARQLGEDDYADDCFDSADAAQDYLRANFLEKDGRLLKDLRGMQTPAVFALKFELVEDAARDATLADLKKNIADHGGCLQTGFLGTSFLMQVLTEAEETEIAYSLLLQRKNPSWLYSVDQGATTVWERWNSYRRDTGFGDVAMNSFNHYAYGAVLDWMYGTMAGIQPGPKGGFDEMVELAPVPDPRLGFVEATYRNKNGVIRSAWRYGKDGRCIWKFSIPAGTRATVCVNGMCRPYKSGDWELEIK